MPYAVLVGRAVDTEPTFVVPYWTRRGGEAEAARARTKLGVGFIVTPFLSLPGPVEDEHLWAAVLRVPWWGFLRWKVRGRVPELGGLGWAGRRRVPPPRLG